MHTQSHLRDTELAELLQSLADDRKTGALVFSVDSAEKRLFYKGGKIVATGSSLPSEYLGHFLVSRGYITETELDKAIELQEETGMLIGKILVTIHAISEEELRGLLVEKAEETIYELFTWQDGAYSFADGYELERGAIPMALDVTRIILAGMRRLAEWTEIRRRIPNGQAVPVGMEALDRAELSEVEGRIAASVNDERTVDEICDQTRSSEFLVCKTLDSLAGQGRLKIVSARLGSGTTGQQLQATAAPPTEPTSESQNTAAQNTAAQNTAAQNTAAQNTAAQNTAAQSTGSRSATSPSTSSATTTAATESDLGPLPDYIPQQRPAAADAEPTVEPVEEVELEIRAEDAAPQTDEIGLGQTVRELVQSARTLEASEELELALRYVRAAKCLDPINREVKTVADEIQSRLDANLDADGLQLEAVPNLERAVEELTELQLSPEEGFLLTRIDGRSTISALQRMSQLEPLDVKVLLGKLLRAGHVSLR